MDLALAAATRDARSFGAGRRCRAMTVPWRSSVTLILAVLAMGQQVPCR
jgi:hypothetical protein